MKGHGAYTGDAGRAIVIAIASLVVNIAILIGSGDGSTGPMPGQFGIEQTGES